VQTPTNGSKEEMEQAVKEAEIKQRGPKNSLDQLNPERIRYCNACKAYKPPRSHHCRECKRCVKRMDHHCPWVNNCVGFNNHKYFMLFLTYASTGLVYQIITVIVRLIYGLRETTRVRINAAKLNLAGSPLLTFFPCVPERCRCCRN
jgi:hypothetical protein